MQISDTKLHPQPQVSSTPGKLLQSLRPGQVLRAITVSPSQNGTVQLQIGRTALTAQTNISLQPGEKLTLSVVKGGTQPQLQLITQQRPAQLLQQATMSALPRQQPLQPLLQNLGNLLASGAPLPPPFKALADNFLKSILASSDPAFSQQLRAAINRSGPFLEAQLLTGKQHKLDLKATLSRMVLMLKPLLEQSGQIQNDKLTASQTGSPPTLQIGQLTQAQQLAGALLHPKGDLPPLTAATGNVNMSQPNSLLQMLTDLFKNMEGALARVQLHQVATLQSEESGKTIWQLELPIRHAGQTDTFKMQIEQQTASQGDEATHLWRLTIHFDLKPLGPIDAHLTLSGGEQISTLFWASYKPTFSLLQANLPLLRNNLERAGLKVERIDSYHGKPPEAAQPIWQTSLLDEKA